ncbi:sigma-E factor negative regulatory protein [Acidovorax sp. SDU_ACID1]|uniref:sigma-E factor negative regulatory protein n=1 Tax=Acidovorax sp. SDU_ACID1 TaxID=3136632 RepID=UPI003872BFCE
MKDDVMKRECLSALADGELQGDEFAQAMAYAGTDEGQASWQLYHMIGEVMRCSEPVHATDPALLGRLREQLAREPLPARLPAAALAQVARHDEAANASVFRWKLAAGFASLAAVAALGWNAYVGLTPGVAAAGAQLAAVQPAPAMPPQQQTMVATNIGSDGPQIMIRDPRLDELLAAHKQFGSTSALQMPAGFLRNATFEAPAR